MFVLAVAVVLARYFGIGWLEQLLGKMFGIGGQQHADGTQPGTDNNGPPPQESPTREHEGTEMGNNGPPQVPHPTEPVGTQRDNAQPSSSSSMTTGPLHIISEPQTPAVLGTQSEITQSEIEEEW